MAQPAAHNKRDWEGIQCIHIAEHFALEFWTSDASTSPPLITINIITLIAVPFFLDFASDAYL